jgi:SAM-dependent methyltransferase
MKNPWLATRRRAGSEYDAPYEAREAAGFDVHGEANLIEKLLHSELNQITSTPPYRVLDAGCGTGRLAIELAKRGVETVGVDLDEVMLSQARKKAPQLDWQLGDLCNIDIGKVFDAIVLAGNVMLYVTPGTEAETVANMGRHLKRGGLLVAAFELSPPSWSRLTLEVYEQLAASAGLVPVARWSTWEQAAWHKGDAYAVVVHTKS